MNQGNLFQHEWHNQTTLHPLGVVAILVLGAAVLLVRRQHGAWPLIVMACFVAASQRVVIMGADFTLLRILLIFGMIRVIIKREYSTFQWNKLDTLLVLWATASFAIPLLRQGTEGLLNRCGQVYDIFGMYFYFRCIVRDSQDIMGIATGLAWCSIPAGLFFLLEWATGRNVFSLFGGVPEITVVRDGKLRCQGAFSHPILAGCFWAGAIPLIASQWRSRRKLLSAIGVTLSIFIVLTSNSSTPILGLATAAIGWFAYPVRHYLFAIRLAIAMSIVALHIVMNAPVWHLIARIPLGGSSYHRYQLIDGAIRHIHEWWLFGSYKGTAHWGHYTFDVANHYIGEAISGGLIQLVCFVLLLAGAFATAGRAMRASPSRSRGILAWAMGVAILVHAVNFMGISYGGQIWVLVYLTLAAAVCMSSDATQSRQATIEGLGPIAI